MKYTAIFTQDQFNPATKGYAYTSERKVVLNAVDDEMAISAVRNLVKHPSKDIKGYVLGSLVNTTQQTVLYMGGKFSSILNR